MQYFKDFFVARKNASHNFLTSTETIRNKENNFYTFLGCKPMIGILTGSGEEVGFLPYIERDVESSRLLWIISKTLEIRSFKS